MGIFNFIPRIPTEEEMKQVALNWWVNHEHINFAAWNSTLIAYTFPFRLVKLPRGLIDEMLNMYDGKGDVQALKDKLSIELKVDDLSEGFFIKLITRSPKDVLYDETNFGKPWVLYNIDDVFNAVFNSMRCFEDLCLLRYLEVPTVIIRPYIKFHPQEEWRVLVKDSQIVGVSQYYYQHSFYEDESIVKRKDQEVRAFMSKIVIPNVSTNTFVADIVTCSQTNSTVLLELNPYGISDPCLFGEYENLDGTTLWNLNGVQQVLKD